MVGSGGGVQANVSCLGAHAGRNNRVALIPIYHPLSLTLSSSHVLLIGVSAANWETQANCSLSSDNVTSLEKTPYIKRIQSIDGNITKKTHLINRMKKLAAAIDVKSVSLINNLKYGTAWRVTCRYKSCREEENKLTSTNNGGNLTVYTTHIILWLPFHWYWRFIN